jgi:hypothetical protein
MVPIACCLPEFQSERASTLIITIFTVYNIVLFYENEESIGYITDLYEKTVKLFNKDVKAKSILQ